MVERGLATCVECDRDSVWQHTHTSVWQIRVHTCSTHIHLDGSSGYTHMADEGTHTTVPRLICRAALDREQHAPIPQTPPDPSASIDSSASNRHILHRLLMRWCWQRPAPPHSLHVLLMRWCWQMLAPPHSLHSFLLRWCSHRPAPPHSLHRLLRRWCWQRPAPPHSLHRLLMRWCWQMLAPPHSLHSLLRRWCWHRPAPPHSLHVLLRRWCSHRPAPPHSLHWLLRRWCGQTLRGRFCAAPPAGSASARLRRVSVPPPAAPGPSAVGARSSPGAAAPWSHFSSIARAVR